MNFVKCARWLNDRLEFGFAFLCLVCLGLAAVAGLTGRGCVRVFCAAEVESAGFLFVRADFTFASLASIFGVVTPSIMDNVLRRKRINHDEYLTSWMQ